LEVSDRRLVENGQGLTLKPYGVGISDHVLDFPGLEAYGCWVKYGVKPLLLNVINSITLKGIVAESILKRKL
jgi:hypothetical protein